MWGESSKKCESNCQCSGLITENFKINSGNSGTKRKQETALSHNYKLKMNPHSIDFTSPIQTKRRILGELQNFKPSSPILDRLKNSPNINSPVNLKSPHISPNGFKSPLNTIKTPLNGLKSPFNSLRSPLIGLNNLNSPIIASHSPLTSRLKCGSKMSRIFEERTKFKMSRDEDKENFGSLVNETYMKLDLEEEARDCSFGDRFQANREKAEQWPMPKLDFTDALPSKSFEETQDILVPEKDQDMDDLESLQDLEAEFENENFDQCTNYEIISTDSPNIISRGRSSTSRKVSSRNFDFGAPIADMEQSTSFNRPATRMLNFDDDDFEFTSPAVKKTVSVKKSLKFNDTPTKTFLRHEKSDSSIGSMSSSPSTRLNRVFTSESTTSMESGFISELEEPFLDIEESNSPKIANFEQLLSGKIKESSLTDSNFLKRRPCLARSLSLHPEPKARVSLLSVLESPGKRSQKRTERSEDEEKNSKRRRSNCLSQEIVLKTEERLQRPLLQRAYSENNASIISALARSAAEPDLIGDFTQPFSLPLTGGEHSDLKSISCETLAALLRGEFHHIVPNYQVIDCRYPYEYEGGHIMGAVNMYTPTQIQEGLVESRRSGDGNEGNSEESVPKVLIFHCEFSLQRGPKLSRYLRSADREKNKENYPSLNYPEVYLLHEGYRAFYKRHPGLCSPSGYIAMLDPKHRDSLRKHRSVGQPATTMRRNRLLL